MIYGNIICTKPGNARRFQNERRDLWVRTAYLPGRELDGLYTWKSFAPNGYKLDHKNFFCVIHFLLEDEMLGLQYRLIGKSYYNPVFDIDRYAVECGAFYREGGVCPVFEKLRAILDEQILRGADKLDVIDDAGRTFVCNGDGRVGPIAPFARDDDFKFLPLAQDLAAICQACEFCRQPGEVRADGGNGERRDGDATVRVAGDGVVDGANDGSEIFHVGIIAFFRRLFGRRK